MTRLLALCFVLASLAACADAPDAPAPEPAAGTSAPAPVGGQLALGDPVPSGDALTPAELIADADSYAGKTVVVEGVAREVCQMAGCWLTFAGDAGQTVRVNVPRDETESYLFTFPEDATGQTIRVAGMLSVETESVEDQRHYAQDGGASAQEVDAITEPKQTLTLTASGAEVLGDDAPADA